MERNAALKHPFRLEKHSKAWLWSCQPVTSPCLYPFSTKEVHCFHTGAILLHFHMHLTVLNMTLFLFVFKCR